MALSSLLEGVFSFSLALLSDKGKFECFAQNFKISGFIKLNFPIKKKSLLQRKRGGILQIKMTEAELFFRMKNNIFAKQKYKLFSIIYFQFIIFIIYLIFQPLCHLTVTSPLANKGRMVRKDKFVLLIPPPLRGTLFSERIKEKKLNFQSHIKLGKTISQLPKYFYFPF